jgi:hypothetical protein
VSFTIEINDMETVQVKQCFHMFPSSVRIKWVSNLFVYNSQNLLKLYQNPRAGMVTQDLATTQMNQ